MKHIFLDGFNDQPVMKPAVADHDIKGGLYNSQDFVVNESTEDDTFNRIVGKLKKKNTDEVIERDTCLT